MSLQIIFILQAILSTIGVIVMDRLLKKEALVCCEKYILTNNFKNLYIVRWALIVSLVVSSSIVLAQQNVKEFNAVLIEKNGVAVDNLTVSKWKMISGSEK